MKFKKILANGLITSVAALSFGFSSAPAFSADFSGERIEWIIPFKEGGGSDQWARFYAPLLAENLPGKPSIAVKNVPGGGSTNGANQFTARAKPDGLTILGTSGSTQFPYLLQDKRVRYEYKDWKVVMASATGGVFYVSPSLNVKNMKELAAKKDTQLIYGSQGATSLDLIPLLAMDLLDIPVKAVFGMKGRGAGRLAFQRGESNIDYQTSSSYLSKVVPMVEAGEAIPMMSWGALDDDGNIVRDPTFPDLPSFPEVYEQVHGKKPSGEAWKAWKAFFVAGFPAQKLVFLPKGTPQDIVDTYVAAAKKTITAPGFKEKSLKVLGTYPQTTGKVAQVHLNAALDLDDQARAWVQNWLTSKYNVKF